MSVIMDQINSAGQAYVEFTIPMLIQSSLLILILLFVDLLLRKKIRAEFRYWIWTLVLVKLALPTSLSTPMSLGHWFGEELDVMDVGQTISAPGAAEINADRHVPLTPGAELPLPVSGQVISPGVPEIQMTWQGIVFVSWLVVVMVMTLMLLNRTLFVRRLVAQAQKTDGSLNDTLAQCCHSMGIRRNVGLRISTNMASPAVCRLFKPVILLPQSLMPSLDVSQLRAILMHELAHLKRYDLWVNLGQTFLQIVYFYNPLLWLANAIIRRAREQAVDEAVLVAMGEKAQEYLETLVNVAKLAFRGPTLSLRLIGVVESKNLFEWRIRTMLSRPLPKSAKLGVLGTIVILVIAIVLLPMAKAEKSDRESQSVTIKNEAKSQYPLHEAAAEGDIEQVKLLITQGMNVNARDQSGCTPLHHVTKWKPNLMVQVVNSKDPKAMTRIRKEAGILAMAKLLINGGADVNIKDNKGNTPLHYAVEGGHRKVAELLINKGSDVNTRNKTGMTPIEFLGAFEQTSVDRLLLDNGADIPTIHVAAFLGDLDKVKEFLAQGVPVDARGKVGVISGTALSFAAGTGQKETAEFLIGKGADVNAGILRWVGNGEVAEILIEHGANVNGSDGSGSPLRDAAAFGIIDVMRVLLAHGADTELKDGNGQTALSISMTYQCKESVLFLTANGADVNTKDRWGQTPLHYAARRGWEDAAEALIEKGADIQARTLDGASPLLYAAMSGRDGIVKLLIEKGADPHAKIDTESDETLSDIALEGNHKKVINVLAEKDATDIPAMHLAAYLGDIEKLKSLVQETKSIEVNDKHGKTPLSFAALGGNTNVVRFLISQKAKVGATDKKGLTPLHEAALGGHKAIVDLLLAAGADINADSEDGTPLHMAILSVRQPEMIDNDDTDMAEFFIDKGVNLNICSRIVGTPLHLAVGRVQKNMVKLLLAKGADVNAKGGEEVKGGTPLHAAISHPYGHHVALYLILGGADVNAKNDNGATLLHLCAEKAWRRPHARLLLAHGAKIDAKDNLGATPLHYAAESGRKDMAELLLNRGADVNIKTNEGKTALSLAIEKNSTEIVELLKKHGAKE